MTAASRRRVIERRGEPEGGGRTNEEAVALARAKLARHLADANYLNNQWRNSLTRVSVALALVLAFRVYREWEDSAANRPDPNQFFRTRLVDVLGVILGILIADYVRKPRDKYPPTFYAALVITVVELAAWVRVARGPDYELHINASLPVGGFYFIFVWLSDWLMSRTLLDAKKGVQSGDRLASIVSGQAKVE